MLTLYYLLVDYLLTLRFHLLSPFSKRPEQWQQGDKGDVIFIQDFAVTWYFFKYLADFFNRLGYRTHIPSVLDYNYFSITDSSKKIEEYIEKHGLKDITLIGYSKGGVIILNLLTNSKFKERFIKVITIAAPFGGTLLGHLRVKNLHEISPISDYCRNNGGKNCENILNIYPKLDNYIIPNKNLVLEGAKNICVDVIGHAKILTSTQTIKEIKDYLNI